MPHTKQALREPLRRFPPGGHRYLRAVEFCRLHGNPVSPAALQRRFQIGYDQALRLLVLLSSRGDLPHHTPRPSHIKYYVQSGAAGDDN